ncbi:hypothetical protein H4W29_005578 [Rhizobium viscosum]|uniref:Uncharacterized protein n=1 Tax=Rhizobium viscosum TaxID=1673 RepID=A0ABR9IYM6_RHIVS|nr:hypothetical protein [Rhizobium viscosum]
MAIKNPSSGGRAFQRFWETELPTVCVVAIALGGDLLSHVRIRAPLFECRKITDEIFKRMPNEDRYPRLPSNAPDGEALDAIRTTEPDKAKVDYDQANTVEILNIACHNCQIVNQCRCRNRASASLRRSGIRICAHRVAITSSIGRIRSTNSGRTRLSIHAPRREPRAPSRRWMLKFRVLAPES